MSTAGFQKHVWPWKGVLVGYRGAEQSQTTYRRTHCTFVDVRKPNSVVCSRDRGKEMRMRAVLKAYDMVLFRNREHRPKSMNLRYFVIKLSY